MPRGTARSSRGSRTADDYTADNEPSDERPARGSRRGAAQDDEPAASSRRSGRGSRDAEPEPSARGSRRSRGSTDDEPPARGRASRRPSDDEDDKPKRRTLSGTGGWGSYEAKKSEVSDFADEFRPEEEQTLIKILDAEPLANYKQHWIERNGKRSWTCCAPEDKCPLCDDVGDNPQLKVVFNIVDMSDPDNPTNAIWIMSQTIAENLKNFGKDSKTGPINRDDLYWAVNKTGKGKGKVKTNIIPVKERDLKEDWDTEPLSEEELTEFDNNAFGEDAVEYHTPRQLAEIADELLK